jgi:hypothetical protein
MKTKKLYVNGDLDQVIRAGAARLSAAQKQTPNATLQSIISNHETVVRERLAMRGIRLMKRRSYTEKAGDPIG